MSGYLLDTNVLSEVIKKKPEPKLTRRLEAARGQRLYTSVICVMELRFGAARLPRGDALWNRIQREVLEGISILNIDVETAILAGEQLAGLERRGAIIGTEDLLIGTSALHHGLTVATRNVRHLNRIQGLRVEDWWA